MLGAQIGQPVPGEHALDADHQVMLPVRGKKGQKRGQAGLMNK